MARKVKPSKQKTTDTDFSSLDSAVSELAQQTKDLLGEHGEKAKPDLPKRDGASSAKPSQAGKNFDIIHPSKPTQLSATLKSTPAKPEAEEKAPATSSIRISTTHTPGALHATGSAPTNIPGQKEATTEKEEPEEAASDDKKEEATQARPVERKPKFTSPISHEGLTFTEPGSKEKEADDTPDNTAAEPESSEPEKPEDSKKVDQEEPEKLAENTDKLDKKSEIPPSDEDKEESKSENEKEEKPEEKAGEESEEEPEASEKDAAKLGDEEPAADPEVLGEIYGTSHVARGEAKGFEPAEGQQKPTVFDANQYHLELHDWSKLQKHSHGLLVIGTILVIIMSAVAYFILSGHTL